MAKKDALYEQAQELYVVKQQTFEEVARRLSVSEKTVRTWAKEGEWMRKRSELLAKRSTMHEMIYDLAYQLLLGTQAELAAGAVVDTGRLYAINSLLATIERTRKYEQQVGIEEPEDAKPESRTLTPERLEQIRQEMLRLK